MQRHENESFADYKTRRANSNAAVKRINQKAKGGNISSREKARSERDNSKHAGAFGRALTASFARAKATPARLKKHLQHLDYMASRKALRAV